MRWVIRTVFALVVLGLIAMGSLLAIPTERIAALVTDRLEQATDRRVVVTGRIRPTLIPYLGARVEGLEIGNPDWLDEGNLLSAESVTVGVSWSALLSGEIRLEEAMLDAPEITLIRAADGRANWDFGDGRVAEPASTDSASEEPSSGGGLLSTLGFDAAEIRNANLRYLDQASGQDLRAEDLDLTLRLPEAGGRGSLEASSVVNGSEIALQASVDGIAALLEGEVRPLTLSLEWDGGGAAFDGRAGLSPAMDGQLSFEAQDLGPLLAVIGQPAPDLPQGLGRDRIAVAGDVTLASEGSMHLRQGRLTLDDHVLTANLDLLSGEDRPSLRGAVQGEEWDLSALTGGAQGEQTEGGSSDGSTTGGWPRDPIDVSGLFALDAEITLALARLDLGLANLDGVDLLARLDQGRLVLEFRRVGAYDGAMSGTVVVNGRGGLSTRADLAFRDVSLRPLMEELAGYDRLEGRGDLAINVLGVGNDVASLMQSLEGTGQVQFGQGAILGFDLAGMIRNFDPSFQGEGQRTVFDSLNASFAITSGVLQNDDLVLAAPWGQVTGAGEADIGAQTLNYRVIPGVMQGADGSGGISVPILITGPWADLSFRPDLAFIAEQELAEERERLEAEARARLAEEQERLEQSIRDQASDALGLDIQEGQSQEEVEDALEQRLREQAEEQLRRLFD
ncbi:AsmA family protein [Roseobacter sp. HKCCD9010]|uniref:AsmA family protein n=1 Tax=unclassified Roseobacter TaxID=196798 RepID=UPI001490D13C|nr:MULTISPECIES: AsmA family protein [unclassified Roseobacter]MBF9048891.1 AsmA family protein [Rhodobacterales bacterium HKCCD4356]NNV10890.1 AsmA family protein [Roseobacter sp. HKCCD7357]NNV15075.1 AsmA family protein [Roseobacter sp. HKCCD8768]NNV24534.1 AsmA family protein [Roseobacter sp. HKCCD8192]NNV28791.1 AsmA family protein [Roseobacter sp. HKCCD9061]